MKSALIRRFRTVAVLLALAAFSLPLTAVPQAQAAGKVLHYSMNEPDTIDPQRASYANQVALVQGIFRGLLRYDADGNTIPSIAVEVPSTENGGISKDGLTYTYKLRDWKWSDGKGNVTAGDFVYSLQRLVDPVTASPYGGFLNDIVVNATEIQSGKAKPTELGAKAVDDKTLEIKLVKPVSYLNPIMALWATYAVRKDNVERAGDPTTGAWTDPANGPIVGNGPFVLTSWDHQKEMVFDKNPNFSGSAAKIDQIIMPLTDDPAVAYAGYKSGELDVSNFPTSEYAAIQADAKLGKELLTYPNTCISYLSMDNTKPPFDKKEVRQAISYAVDRDLYVKVVSLGLAKSYYSFLPSSVPGNDPNAGTQYKFDPAKAKELLAKAGYPDGKGFPKVQYNYTAGATTQRRADWFKAQFKQVLGIDINYNPMDGAVFQNLTNQPVDKLPGFVYTGWCADYLHASDYLSLVMSSGGESGNALNVSGYKSAEFDKAAKDADNELDAKVQAEKYKKVQDLMLEDAPVVFMNSGLAFSLASPKVTNLKTSALDSGFPGSFFWEDIDLAS